MSPSPEYWSAAATTLPVLSTALVIEGRALAAKYRASAADFVLALNYIPWALSLVGMGYGTLQCFRALRGSLVPDWSTSLIENSVTLCLGTLVGSPALLFFTEGIVLFTSVIRHTPRNLRTLRGVLQTIRETQSLKRETRELRTKGAAMREYYLRTSLYGTEQLEQRQQEIVRKLATLAEGENELREELLSELQEVQQSIQNIREQRISFLRDVDVIRVGSNGDKPGIESN